MLKEQKPIKKTSETHPLQIAEVRPGVTTGRVGITFCPGKKQAYSVSGPWDRNLEADLCRIEEWGACAVVTLIEEHEFTALSVDGLGDAVRQKHMVWYHLPIRDVSVPDQKFEQAWEVAGQQLLGLLSRGFDIVVHCKGGLGRAGTIAARLLIELGVDPVDAIASVRAVRSGAIETFEQEQYVKAQRRPAITSPERSPSHRRDRAIGALVGLAVGDAVGTTLEFTSRDRARRLIDMIGGGPFGLKAGQWTDDTALALALADSLIACEGIDEADLMERFARWRDQGAYSCTGTCFDVGITTAGAIDRFKRTGEPIAGPISPATAGNGSLMRLAPVALAHLSDPERRRDAAARQSRTTHGAPAAVAACTAYADLLADIINGYPLTEALDYLASSASDLSVPEIRAVAQGSWRGKSRSKVKGSGYVVESLEAAIWSVARTATFEDAVLTAANLGDDADTTAAITGQLAGAVYGLSAIPELWLAKLAWRDRIVDLSERLLALDRQSPGDLGGQVLADPVSTPRAASS